MEDNAQKPKQPLLSHFAELRFRLIRSLWAILIIFSIAIFFSNEMINFLKVPLLDSLPEGNKSLYFTGPLDVFMVSLKSSFLVAFILSCPIWIYQFWSFLAPALHKSEKKYIRPFILASIILFFTGVSFCFAFIIPLTLKFLIGLGSDVGVPMITITDYFSLLSLMIIGFGLVFELPVILLLLGFLNIISSKTLIKYRRHVIVVSLILSAVLTPPDPVSQLGLAIPLYIMYEISIVLLRFMKGKGKS